MHGEGIFSFAKGGYAIGSFKNNKMHGKVYL